MKPFDGICSGSNKNICYILNPLTMYNAQFKGFYYIFSRVIVLPSNSYHRSTFEIVSIWEHVIVSIMYGNPEKGRS